MSINDTPTAAIASEVATIPLICAADVVYTEPNWLIYPLFQRGKGTLIQADPGTGKTAFMCAIAASVTTGCPILGLTVETPGPVLMLSVEDDEGVLKARVAANNGDVTKLFFHPDAVKMTLDSPEIEQAIKQIGAKLVIFDPMQAFLGPHVDMFRANETRPKLAKLFEMCARNDCACAIIAHTGKSTLGKSMVNHSLGSVDIPAAMRSVIHIAKNPTDDAECIAIHAKSSNAPRCHSIAFGIIDEAAIEWHGFCDVGEADISNPSKLSKKVALPYASNDLVQVFKALIADRPGGGFWSYSDVQKAGARVLGYPPYNDAHHLKQQLTASLLREIQSRDGLIISHGQKQNGTRGIRIERCQAPKSGK